MLPLVYSLWFVLEVSVLIGVGVALLMLALWCGRAWRRGDVRPAAWTVAVVLTTVAALLVLPALLQTRAALRAYEALGPATANIEGSPVEPVSVEVRPTDPNIEPWLRPEVVLGAAPSVVFVEVGTEDGLAVDRVFRFVPPRVKRAVPDDPTTAVDEARAAWWRDREAQMRARAATFVQDDEFRSSVVLTERTEMRSTSWRAAVWSWSLDVSERAGRPLGRFVFVCLDVTSARERGARTMNLWPLPSTLLTERLVPLERRIPASVTRCSQGAPSLERLRQAGLTEFLRRVLTPGS